MRALNLSPEQKKERRKACKQKSHRKRRLEQGLEPRRKSAGGKSVPLKPLFTWEPLPDRTPASCSALPQNDVKVGTAQQTCCDQTSDTLKAGPSESQAPSSNQDNSSLQLIGQSRERATWIDEN